MSQDQFASVHRRSIGFEGREFVERHDSAPGYGCFASIYMCASGGWHIHPDISDLGMVEAGLDRSLQNRLGLRIPDVVWKAASAVFALNSKGTVPVFLRGPAGPIWSRTESLILNALGRGILPR
jgi:hypothetical protein